MSVVDIELPFIQLDMAGDGAAYPLDTFPAVRETGRAFLIRQDREQGGYGLYCYILFGAPPAQAMQEHYLEIARAWIDQFRDIAGFAPDTPRMRLNVTYNVRSK